MPGSHCANFARRRTLLLVLCNLLWASTYEYGAPQELTRGSVPDSLADAYSQSPLYPPSGGHGGAPRLSNVGHDFALLSWDAPPEGTVGWRVFSSRWRVEFARHHAPDIQGTYDLDGEALEVCARPDGARGRGRFAAVIRSSSGGFVGLAAGAWDVVQGGYAGHALYSNGSAVSGVQLWYPHRDDGALQLVDLPSHVRPPKPIELPDDGDDAAEEADEAAIAKAAAMQAAYDAFDPDAPRAPRARLARWRRRFVETACDHMLPGPEDADGVAPEITGHYFSNYNESVAVCTANGSLVGAFSGLGEHQGLLTARWNGRRRRWVGAIALPDGADTFAWQVRPDGALAGDLRDGLTGWTLHNRTWDFVSVNGSVPDPWYAARQADVGGNPQARALGEGPPFAGSLEPLCNLLRGGGGAGMRAGGGGDGEVLSEWEEAASATLPTWPQLNCTNTSTNASYDCDDHTATYDSAGFYRRARVEELSTWSEEEILVPHTGLDIPRVVVSPLTLGDRLIFRVAPLLPHPPFSFESCDAGASCGRCLKLLPKSECPRVPDLPLRCDVAPMNYTCEADGECGTDGGANNCGGFDLYVVTYIAPGDPLRVGPRSPWTSPHVVALSGPGAPVGLTSDHVTAHGLTLHWEPPADESAVPALARRGVWHAHGGGRLLGYRIYARAAHEPLSAMRLVGSTTELSHTLRLPSQTLWRFRVAAESHVRRGLNSTELIVATGALRATLWTRCGYKTATYHADSYEGCYREQRAPEAAAGVAMPLVAPRGAAYSPQLTRMECSKRCEGYKYYGMHNGGTCVCSNSEEDGSVGAAAALRREESGDDGGDDEGDGDGRGRLLSGGDDDSDGEGDDSDDSGTWGFGRFGAVSDPECDAPCTGDSAERCGGVARLSVWRRGGRVGVVLNAGEYKQYDLIFRKLPPRAVEAVELPPGLRMTLYQEDDFSGLSLNVTGSTACLRDTACGHPPHTTNWAYPPQGCSAHDWAGQAGSLKIEYVENGPPYPPRTGIETGARAWLRSTSGRRVHAPGDPTGEKYGGANFPRESWDPNQGPPRGPLTFADAELGAEHAGEHELPEWGGWPVAVEGDAEAIHAARDPDDAAAAAAAAAALEAEHATEDAMATARCAIWRGGYSADRVCLATAEPPPGMGVVHGHRTTPLTFTKDAQRRFKPSKEYVRLTRIEWRKTLREYARPFFDTQMMEGDVPPTADYASWFDEWYRGLAHLLDLLAPFEDAGPAELGLDDAGRVTSVDRATAPSFPQPPITPNLLVEGGEAILDPATALREGIEKGLPAVEALAREVLAMQSGEEDTQREAYELSKEAYEKAIELAVKAGFELPAAKAKAEAEAGVEEGWDDGVPEWEKEAAAEAAAARAAKDATDGAAAAKAAAITDGERALRDDAERAVRAGGVGGYRAPRPPPTAQPPRQPGDWDEDEPFFTDFR